MTRMISTSVRIGSLSLVNDDVGEETETYLVISKSDHIEDLESSVVAKISPRAEIEDHEGNEINQKPGKKFKDKTKEQDKHEENR